jgi:prepilin peptidase CpaA
MEITAFEAIWLLPPALPVALWVAWSDLKYMKITNRAVIVMAVVFLVFGLIALPLETYLWRLLQLVVVLLLGFVANALRLVGGGDAKYSAAIAPFFAYGDTRPVLLLFAAMLLAAYITHRAFSMIGPIRRMTENWKSWNAGKDFPMGLALSGTLIFYLVLGLMGL